MPPGQLTDSAPSELDARYGRTPRRMRWNRRGTYVVAGAFVAIFAAWVVWGGLDGTTASVDAVDTAHSVIDEHSVSVTAQVSIPAGTTASCAMQAQNEAHGIVGWKIVDLSASESRTRSVTTVVKTSELAVTGLIYRCWLT